MTRFSAFFAVLTLALFPAIAVAAPDKGEVTNRLLAALYGDSGAVETDLTGDLRTLYARTGYRPIWWQEGGWSRQARDAIAALDVSNWHGINNARYGADTLGQLMALPTESLSVEGVTYIDLALSSAMLAYVGDQASGRADPSATNWYARTDAAIDPVDLLVEGLGTREFAAWLDDAAPLHGSYGALVVELSQLNYLTPLPWTDLERQGLIRAGETDARIPEIRDRLITLGDYRVTRGINPVDQRFDASSQVYDDALVAAVEQFQHRHGLEDDGVIGPKTMAALNMSPAERMQTIAVNLERLRWLPDPSRFAGRHIVVNVAGYHLTAYLDGAVALTMPVIVGQPRHKTPLLADQIVNVKFAPTWTVPERIARRELLPKIQEDPTYLSSNNFRVFADWSATVEVDPASIDWTSYTTSYLPFMLRQDPGPSNALGQIRFSLSNDLDIYLHDTGSRHLFTEAERSLSQGCVRVGAPVELADFLLDGLDKTWTRDEILNAMDAPRPHYQRLAEPVPVDLVYVTAWVDDDGSVHYRKDIYGYDQTLAEQLTAVDNNGNATLVSLMKTLDGLDIEHFDAPDSPTVTAALSEAAN